VFKIQKNRKRGFRSVRGLRGGFGWGLHTRVGVLGPGGNDGRGRFHPPKGKLWYVNKLRPDPTTQPGIPGPGPKTKATPFAGSGGGLVFVSPWCPRVGGDF